MNKVQSLSYSPSLNFVQHGVRAFDEVIPRRCPAKPNDFVEATRGSLHVFDGVVRLRHITPTTRNSPTDSQRRRSLHPALCIRLCQRTKSMALDSILSNTTYGYSGFDFIRPGHFRRSHSPSLSGKA